MYAVNSPVSEESQIRIRGLRGKLRCWFDAVPSPPEAWLTSSAGLSTWSFAPPLDLYASPEEVKRLYPEAPTRVKPPAAARVDGPDAAPHKRARDATVGVGGPGEAEAKRDEAAAASDVVPTASFTAGFSRVDYMGRSFIEPPPALVQQAEARRGRPCDLPRTLKGVFGVPAAAEGLGGGVQLVRWGPPAYGHLLFAGTLQGGVGLWHGQTRALVARFTAHARAIQSLEVAADASRFSTAALDGRVAVWDVAAGACAAVLTNPGAVPARHHRHLPSDPDVVLVALDSRVALYDLRVSAARAQREFAGHRGRVLHLRPLRDPRTLLTSAADATLRTWDLRLAAPIRQRAADGPHAIAHVLAHPTRPDLLAAQSMANRVVVLRDLGGGRLGPAPGPARVFAGHTVAGTACRLAFSPDGRFLSSGDLEGNWVAWAWHDGRVARAFRAHAQTLVSHAWHPLEPARVVTAGWDGSIKNWA